MAQASFCIQNMQPEKIPINKTNAKLLAVYQFPIRSISIQTIDIVMSIKTQMYEWITFALILLTKL